MNLVGEKETIVELLAKKPNTEPQKKNDDPSLQDKANRAKRLEYLLKQTEKFAEFIQVSDDNMKIRETKRGRPKKVESPRVGRAKKGGSTPKRAVRYEEEIEKDTKEVHEFKSSPAFISGEMRDYQIIGLNWLIRIYENGLNGILADEMGLGKTLQTISLLGYLRHYKNIPGKHIIFSTKSTVFNWVKEINRWCPEFRAVAYVGTKEEREKIEKTTIKPQKFDILVTNYEMMLNETFILKSFNWHYLIVDEGHRLKNENSSFSKLTRQLKSSHRLILTGTPLQNNLHELWALLNFLLPDIFSRADDFDSWFDTTTVLSSGESLVTRLHTILKPFFLRRIKSDVEKSLLPKIEYKLYIGITNLQRELYIKTLKKEFEYFNAATCRSYQVHEPSQILMNLRKICNHPYLLPGVEEEPFVTDEKLVQVCGKMQLLDKLLGMLKKQGSKVLIFAQFKIMMCILEDYFIMRGYKYCRLDGETTFEERMEYMEDFNRKGSDKFIFLLSTRAGGLGINLTAADTVIIYDSDWNPQVDIQAEDRAHRIGQTKQVKVFRLISEKTIDERIIQRAAIKLRLDQKVIQEGRLLDSAKVGKSEMMGMIYFDMEEMMKSTESTITDESIQQIMKRSQEKSKELEKQVKNSEINFENFDTIFKFDGENYQNAQQTDDSGPSTRRRTIVRDVEVEEIIPKLIKVARPKPEVVEPPLPDVTEYPKIYEFQFYNPKLLDLLKKQYFWYLKKSNKRPPLEYKERVECASELSEREEEQTRRFLKGGFDWTPQEFEKYLKWITENGNRSIKTQIVPTRSMPEIRKYHQVFWKKFVEFKDSELRLTCYKALYKIWEPTILKVHKHCKGDIQNMSNIGCKFRINCGFSRFAVAYIVKKLHLDGTKNPDLFQEMSGKLKKIRYFIYSSTIKKNRQSRREPQNMIFMINMILENLDSNIDLYYKDRDALGEKDTENKRLYFEDLENWRRKRPIGEVEENEDENEENSDNESVDSEKSEVSEVSVKTKTSVESGYNSVLESLPPTPVQVKSVRTSKVLRETMEVEPVKTENDLEPRITRRSLRSRAPSPISQTPKRRKVDDENSSPLTRSTRNSIKTENSPKVVLQDEFKRKVLKVKLENVDIALRTTRSMTPVLNKRSSLR